jgi:hypothetical protein
MGESAAGLTTVEAVLKTAVIVRYVQAALVEEPTIKKIEDTVDKHLYDQMHLRLQTPYAKGMKKLRQATVEPVLGTLINFMGIRRIWTRGLQNANKFMLGAAVAYNIKKWLAYTEQKRKTAIVSLKTMVEELCFWLLAVRCFIHQHNTKSKNLFIPC